MGTVLDAITSASVDPNVGAGLEGDLQSIGGTAVATPSGVGEILNLAPQLALPDVNALFGEGPARLSGLVTGGLPSADSLWGPLTGGVGGLESALGSGLGADMPAVFDRIRAAAVAVPEDPSELLGALADPLRQAAGALGESPALAHLTELVGKIEEIRAQIEAAPAELAALLTEQIQSALEEATGLLAPTLDALDRFLANLAATIGATSLDASWNAVLQRLLPEGSPPLAEAIGGLDFGSTDDVLAVDIRIRDARLHLERFAVAAEAQLGQVTTLGSTFGAAAWAQRAASAATTASQLQINDVTAVLQTWRDALTSARSLVTGVSPQAALQPLRDAVAQLGPLTETLDLDGLKTALLGHLQSVTDAQQAVTQAQVDVLAGAQELANTITETIDAIDLSAVGETIAGALSSVDTIVGQIEDLIDSVSTELQGGLTSLRDDLDDLHHKLVDPEGAYRKPLNDFLGEIRDAIPDDIPQQLEAAGQAIGDAVSSLDQIAFDPVFDAVVQELDEMRQKLEEIEPSSLNPLLEAALSAALLVFQIFDFEGEVTDALTTEFDEAVAEFAEPGIQALQDEVDEILAVVRANGPATLLGGLGIEETYQDVVGQIESFRPSELLQEPLAELRAAAGRLSEFTPGAVLQPLLEPLDQVKQAIKSISLEPVFAQLDDALGRLDALVAELDVTPFVAQLDDAVEALRQKLDALLTTDGLLDFLRPIHEALMSALHALDPTDLLKPITDARQTLLDGVEAVDLHALDGAFAAIGDAVDSFRLPGVRDRFAQPAHALGTSLAALDVPGKLQQLGAPQEALKTALDSVGPLADAEAERRRQTMIETVEAMHPLTVLAGSVTAFRSAQAAVGALTRDLDAVLADGSALQAPLDALATKLHEVTLGLGAAGADAKQGLRNAINQTFGELGIDELEDLFDQVETTFQSFGPDGLEAALDEVLAPVREFADNLPKPSELLADVVEAFDGFKALVNPGLHDFVDGLRTDVQPIFDAIGEKVDELDPAALLAELDDRYQEIQELSTRLLDKLEALVGAVDAPYLEVVQLLDDLNPGTVLIEPLQETYDAILAKIDGIDVRAVFEPLLQALTRLRDKLVQQLQRTEQAFERFLSASPGGAGAAVAVGVG